jgi:hypothetical protein
MNTSLHAIRRGAVLGSRLAYTRTSPVLPVSPRCVKGFSSTGKRLAAPTEELSKANVQPGTEGVHERKHSRDSAPH